MLTFNDCAASAGESIELLPFLMHLTLFGSDWIDENH